MSPTLFAGASPLLSFPLVPPGWDNAETLLLAGRPVSVPFAAALSDYVCSGWGSLAHPTCLSWMVAPGAAATVSVFYLLLFMGFVHPPGHSWPSALISVRGAPLASSVSVSCPHWCLKLQALKTIFRDFPLSCLSDSTSNNLKIAFNEV